MNWSQFGISFGVLVGGCVLRALVPYVLTGLQSISSNGWRAWPKFEPKYAASVGVAVIGYGLALITVPGAVESLISMPPISIVALGYGGGDLIREGIKLLAPKLR